MFGVIPEVHLRSPGVIVRQCVCLAVVATLAASSLLRVIGGRDAEKNELPYVVRLENKLEVIVNDIRTIAYYHVCTCSVLTTQWTLTARHCVDPTISGSRHTREYLQVFNVTFIIRYGSPTGKPSNTQTSRVLDQINYAHRNFKITSDDISLLRTEPIILIQYGKISAYEYLALQYKEVTVVGYGLTNYTDRFNSEEQLQTTLVLNRPLQVVKGLLKKCDTIGFSYPYLCLSESCARSSSICPGDSGGPVIHRSGIVALTSQAPVPSNCQMKSDRFRRPDFAVVLPLSPYLNWINNEIRNYSKTGK